MSRPDLQATLGVDGRPFQDGLNRVFQSTNAKMAAVGRTMGRRMMGGILAVLGVQSVTRMISETMRWARDTQRVREEYERMGVVLDDEVVNKLANAGKEFARLGMTTKLAWLPVMSWIAETFAAIAVLIEASAKAVNSFRKEYLRYRKEVIAKETDERSTFWGTFFGTLSDTARDPGSGAGGKETNWQQFKRAWREANAEVAILRHNVHGGDPNFSDVTASASAAFKKVYDDLIARITASYGATAPAEVTKFNLGRSGGGGRLASIGGDVGGLNDRVLQIEREQVRLLKAIETNTKPKAGAGTLEISGT